MRPIRAGIAGLATVGFLAVLPVQAMAAPDSSGVVINEIVYGDALVPGTNDSIELYNAGTETVDLTGWSLHDDKDCPGETDLSGSIAPGEFKVLVEGTDFTFGFGKGDTARLFNGEEIVDSYTYEVNANENWSRCPDGTGDFAQGTRQTLGEPNDCTVEPEPEVETQLVLNEVDSGPADWVEFINPGSEALDISGYEIRDNSDDHRWRFPEGTVINPGQYLVVDADAVGLIYNDQTGEYEENTFQAAIGIGSGDSIRVYDYQGELIESVSWTAHAAIDGDEAAATIARCPDTTGNFQIALATPGEANVCPELPVVINEIESNGDVTDWVEIMNIGTYPVNISGWYMYDDGGESRVNDVTPVEEGTILWPGELFVFDQNVHFTFGLGKNDLTSVYTESGILVTEESTGLEHAAGSLSRCPDGTREFVDVAVTTKGQLNACGNPVVLNEVESKDADGGEDWVELANPLDEPLDISGLVIRDDKDDSEYVIAENTVIDARGYVVIDDLGFGLGGADSVRVFDGDMLVEEYSWTEHADHTYGRCPDMTGDFAQTREATPGARNSCDGIPDLLQYYSTGEPPVVVDEAPMFLEDSSGLDYADGFLWAVDNGTGKFWKLAPQADGSVQFADGWEDGKRARFIKDADNPDAAGPDAEGITIAGDGNVYLAVERDNSNKGVNYNVILQVTPNAEGPDVVASAEWDITDLLPEVSANMGIEAIEWITNAEAKGRLFDENTGEAYDPANYPNAVADGVFVVALEDNGHVYAFSLAKQGEVAPFAAGSNATLLTSYDSFIGGAMGLDYSRNTLRIMSDDGYEGVIAEVFFDGTNSPRVVHYERPDGMDNLNNEGYAESDCIDGNRYAWFFADGFESGALRAVLIDPESAEPCLTDPDEPTDPTETTEPTEPTEPSEPTEPTQPTEPTDPTEPTKPVEHTKPSEPSEPGEPSVPSGGKPGDLAKTGVETAGLAAIAGLLLAAGGVAVWSRRINS
ncbi:MAG: lamin tail domain-containing protein [Gleimia sp.]|jgi:LPXTG-motif cell wall-anchored protein